MHRNNNKIVPHILTIIACNFLDEVLVDWETWGAWVDELSGDGYRERVCKNKGPNAVCRGKAIQKRKRIMKDTPDDDKGIYILSKNCKLMMQNEDKTNGARI